MPDAAADTPSVFSGGLDPRLDYPVFDAPEDPDVGENQGFWFFEDDGAFSFHVHLEANSPLWDSRREMVHILLADGRAASDWQYGLGTTRGGPGSAATRSECVDPFDRWELTYRGMPYFSAGSVMASQPLNMLSCDQVPLELSLDIRSGGDPWVQGALSEGGMTKDATEAMGGFRYEQLFRAEGTLQLGGERRPVRGTGLRTHRIGRRSMVAFGGHCWQTVLFPSGRGFGFQRMFRPDGSIAFDEGYVLENGRLTAAQIVQAPAMKPKFAGEHVRSILSVDGVDQIIDGETIAIHHWSRASRADRKRLQFGTDLSDTSNLVLSNGCVRVEWNGEIGYGLLERSALAGKLI